MCMYVYIFANLKSKLKDIQVVKFAKGFKHIYWKTSFKGLNSAPGGYSPRCIVRRGIAPVKINGIIENMNFGMGIKSNNDSEDLSLVQEFDVNDIQN